MTLKKQKNAPIQATEKSLSFSQVLDYRLFGLVRIEIVLYALIFLVALVTRFWDLGSKTLHHDESLHAVYANYLYEGVRKFLDNVVAMFSLKMSLIDVIKSYFGTQRGEGLNYYFDPMMHGPSLFHLQAGVFFFAGLFTYLWKLPPVILVAFIGIVLCSMLWLSRYSFKKRWKKYALSMALLLIHLGLLFALVYKFTDYSSNKLAGVSDYSSRIAPALLAVLLVMLPYLFRSYLGKLGSLITAVVLLISPSALYIGRFQRHDIYLMVPAVIIVYALLTFIKTRRKKYLYLLALAIGFIYTTHESYFIIGFAFFLLLAGTLVFEFIEHKKKTSTTPFTEMPLAGSIKYILSQPIILLVSISLFLIPVMLLYSTFFSNPQGFFRQALPNPFDTTTALGYWLSQQDVARGSQNWKYYLTLMLPYEPLAVFFGLLSIGIVGYRMGKEKVNQALILLGTLGVTFIGIQAEDLLRISRYQQMKQAGTLTSEHLLNLRQETVVGTTVYTVFFLLLFFIPYFVARSKSLKNQKQYTPSLLLPFSYFAEFFLINWLIIVFIVLSWAGEKMPWINLQIAVPMIFLSTIALRDILTSFYKLIQQLPFIILTILGISFYCMFLLMHPETVVSPSIWFVPLILLAVCILVLLLKLQATSRQKVALIITTLWLGLLTTYSFVSACRVSYKSPDDPEELLVYTQSSKDVISASEKIKKVAHSLGNPKDIRITIESTQTWPFVWYLQDFDKIGYPATITATSNEEIILIAKDSDARMKPILKDYVGEQYTLRWWWLVDLSNWHDNKANQTNYFKFWTSPELWKWIFTRQVWSIKGTYDGMLYVRKDKAQEVWTDAAPVGSQPVEQETPDPYLNKTLKPTLIKTWGQMGSNLGDFNEPKTFTVDSLGNVYVVDRKNNRIQKFNASGNFVLSFGQEGSETGQFKEPSGIAIDSNNNLYVADTWNHRIQQFSPEGTFIATFGKPGQSDSAAEFWGPRGIAISGNELFVTDTGNKKIKKFDLNGTLLNVWGEPGFDQGKFNEPIGIAVDNNYVYVADTWNHRIQKFDHEGNFTAAWDIAGWQGQHNNNEPYLALDTRGDILATDPPNHRILKFSPSGEFIGSFGKNGTGDLEFDKPTGITVDKNGNIYIADTINSRVQKIKL